MIKVPSRVREVVAVESPMKHIWRAFLAIMAYSRYLVPVKIMNLMNMLYAIGYAFLLKRYS